MALFFGVLLISAGLLIIGANYRGILLNRKNIAQHHSLVPLVGPFLLMIGTSFIKYKLSIWIIILSFIIDPGTLAVVIGLPFVIIKDFFNNHK